MFLYSNSIFSLVRISTEIIMQKVRSKKFVSFFLMIVLLQVYIPAQIFSSSNESCCSDPKACCCDHQKMQEEQCCTSQTEKNMPKEVDEATPSQNTSDLQRLLSIESNHSEAIIVTTCDFVAEQFATEIEVLNSNLFTNKIYLTNDSFLI